VLITLAIIGIIAAITIPSIVANHQKRTLETQFAKSYRIIMQAVNLAVAEHGGVENWEWKDTYSAVEMDEFVKNYFLPYFNHIKYCPADNSVKGCYHTIKQFNDSIVEKDNMARPKILLQDGTCIIFNFIKNGIKDKNRSMAIEVDTNGVKKPNKVAYDNFAFNIYPVSDEFLPFGINDTYDEDKGKFNKFTNEEIINNCPGELAGWACAARIIQDGFKINY